MAINFNTDPYWDDYEIAGDDGLSPKEKYSRILFRPGVPLQARELTQLQSSLQHQLSAIGDHVFTDGSMIIPGGVTNHMKVDYIQLSSYDGDLDAIIGQKITSGENVAKVLHYAESTPSDPATLYINYTSGDGTFGDGSQFAADDESTGTIGQGEQAQSTSAESSVGFGSLVMVENGIYYIRKHFIVVQSDSIIVSKYDPDITMDVGFLVNEIIVGPGDDNTLHDNAIGSPNVTAPGAHRLRITLDLISQLPDADTTNFILVSRIEFGKVTDTIRDTEYGLLQKEFARRTFDESGSYSVNPVTGSFKSSVINPSAGVTLGINPSKAYVKGYEIELLSTVNKEIPIADETEMATSQKANISSRSYIDMERLTSASGGSFTLPLYGDEIIFNSNDQLPIGRAKVSQVNNKGHVFFFDYKDEPGAEVGLSSLWTIHMNGHDFTGAMPETVHMAIESGLIQMPYNNIMTHDTDTTGAQPAFDYSYEVFKVIDGITVSTASAASINLNITEESFVDLDSSDWTIYSLDTNKIIDPGFYDIEYLELDTTKVVIQFGTTAYNETDISVMAPVARSLGHKQKEFVLDHEEIFETNEDGVTRVDFTQWQYLENVDISSIKSVELILQGAVEQDLTADFEMDNGQTESKYGMGKFRIKPTSNYFNTIMTNGPSYTIKVVYDYFNHTGSGDFFSIDSYIEGGIDYDDVPNFGGYPLGDVIDFRYIEDGTATELQSAKCMRPGSLFETNLQYYLPRIDKVCLTEEGVIEILHGISSLTPPIPDDIPDSMTVFMIGVPPKTLDPKRFIIKHVDNKRFTMRDIGRIAKRVNRLEYYGTLNLLENVAQNEQIFETDSGLNRFKAGFIVDSFINTRVAGVTSSEYRASIDKYNSLCRPTFEENNVSFKRVDEVSTSESIDGIVTLPYTETSAIVQNKSSGYINVNPYEVFNWSGTLKLSPSSDVWKSIVDLPEITINTDGEYDALLAEIERTNVMGNIWNGWETKWTGRSASYPDEFVGLATRVKSGGGSAVRTTVKQRTGYSNTLEVDDVESNRETKITNVELIPFMRSRLVDCKLTLCRPETTLYPFFDGIPVDDFCTDDTVAASGVDVETQSMAKLSGHPAGSTTLKTDDSGKLEFSFWVPNTDDLQFACGQKEFLLTDQSGNITDLTTTSAVADYHAMGQLQEQRLEITTTRVPRVVRTELGTQTSITTKYWDPLAQTFMLENPGGSFVTSIDLHFATAPITGGDPITVSIRQVLNGYPTQVEIPFGECTLEPSQVSTTGPTKFTFDSPVFLKESVEYSFVILSNSNEYNVKYGTIGERDSDTDYMIQGQPYTGVMFKSSNSSTWTPMQSSDLRFTLNVAEFDTQGIINLIPEKTPPMRLYNNPFICVEDEAEVFVKHTSHGLKTGDKVSFGLSDGISGNDISIVNREEGFDISNPLDIGYTITMPTAATVSGAYGGKNVVANSNIVWNTIYPYITQLELKGTTIKWSIESTYRSGNANHVKSWPIEVNSNIHTFTPNYILGNLQPGPNHGIKLIGIMNSDKTNISPIVDLERCSAITITNNINNDSTGESLPDGGAAHAKYVTKSIELDNPSDDLKIWMDISRPSGTDVKVYVKTGANTTEDSLWVEATGDTVPNTGQGEFNECSFTSSQVGTFSMFEVKVVFLSNNTSLVPEIKNFRAIAVI